MAGGSKKTTFSLRCGFSFQFLSTQLCGGLNNALFKHALVFFKRRRHLVDAALKFADFALGVLWHPFCPSP